MHHFVYGWRDERLLADKNNPLTILNSSWPLGEQSLESLPGSKLLQRLCAKKALVH